MFHKLNLPAITLAGLAAVVGIGAPSTGQVVFTSNMTNDQENPPATPLLTSTGAPRPTSFGTATLTLSADQSALTMTIDVFNIDFTGSQTPDANDNLTVAHIHGGPLVTPTTNGPVVWGFIGTPFNDNNPTDTVITPFATGVGATIVSKWDAAEGNSTTLAAQLPNLFDGRTYFNFHTVQFPGGEIRGAIVPEPASLGLMTAVAVALGRRRGRRG